MTSITQPNCQCANCPGSACTCGCQQAGNQQACACGPQCQCAAPCKCAKG